MTAIAHGAKALDYFQVTPEQANTENYIRHDDLSRYLTLRDVTYEIGAVDDLIADGRLRPATVGDCALGEHGPVGPGHARGGRRPRRTIADDFPSTRTTWSASASGRRCVTPRSRLTWWSRTT